MPGMMSLEHERQAEDVFKFRCFVKGHSSEGYICLTIQSTTKSLHLSQVCVFECTEKWVRNIFALARCLDCTPSNRSMVITTFFIVWFSPPKLKELSAR